MMIFSGCDPKEDVMPEQSESVSSSGSGLASKNPTIVDQCSDLVAASNLTYSSVPDEWASPDPEGYSGDFFCDTAHYTHDGNTWVVYVKIDTLGNVHSLAANDAYIDVFGGIDHLNDYLDGTTEPSIWDYADPQPISDCLGDCYDKFAPKDGRGLCKAGCFWQAMWAGGIHF